MARKTSTKKSASKKTTRKKSPMKSRKNPLVQKYIFITGGVVSSIGKGLTAASLGTLLESRGIKVSIMKSDPYINVDPGTMSPLQHGEVYVTEDGAETDLDLGHYERFTSVSLTRSNSVTAGQVYESVIGRERRGDYLGGTVQVIPHITDEIKSRMHDAAQGSEVIIVEIGGTVGDIEGLPFIEAIRQIRVDVGVENTLFVHVTYVPYIKAAGELKSKPTQHSVKELRQVGIQPDFLICRSEKELSPEIKSKIGLFCSVNPDNVIAATDSSSIYEVPLVLHSEKFDEKVVNSLGLESTNSKMMGWEKMVDTLTHPQSEVTIGIVGKYVDLTESYKSLHEAIVHGGIANKSKINVVYIDSEKLNAKNVNKALGNVDGILVPGGFGERGAEGKISAIQYARENEIPFFGICYGMQLAAIEFARNVCGIKDATSREFAKPRKGQKNFVIDYMEEQKKISDMGGTMRLGAYSCHLDKSSRAYEIYKTHQISERHRHRYEFNNKYRPIFDKNGMSLSGICKERDLVEIIEIREHPWYIGVQFHPEFKSKPMAPHPLFTSFVEASLRHGEKLVNQSNKSVKSKKRQDVVVLEKNQNCSVDEVPMIHEDIVEARRVLDIEAKAIQDLREKLGEEFVQAVENIINTSGKVIVTGVGKSGQIGRKIASTFSSTGTPALYVHPTESSHGDLGVIASGDCVLAISNSGESQELVDLINYCVRKGVPLLAMTGSSNSHLAKASNVFLDISVKEEACPMKLAPSSSSTVTLALGDALAMAVLRRKGFDEEDFAEFHPGGSLGRKMLTRVKDLMQSGQGLPVVKEDTPMSEVIALMTGYHVRGAAGVVSPEGDLIGIVTDGGIRRQMLKSEPTLGSPAKDLMSYSPKTIDRNELAQKALFLMEQFTINQLFVVDSTSDQPKKPVGIIHIQDLIKARLK